MVDVGEHHGVEVIRLRRPANRHRFVDRRHAVSRTPVDARDGVHGPLEDVLPVSEVTAKRENAPASASHWTRPLIERPAAR